MFLGGGGCAEKQVSGPASDLLAGIAWKTAYLTTMESPNPLSYLHFCSKYTYLWIHLPHVYRRPCGTENAALASTQLNPTQVDFWDKGQQVVTK